MDNENGVHIHNVILFSLKERNRNIVDKWMELNQSFDAIFFSHGRNLVSMP